MDDEKFEVGKKYKNMKGEYEVLSIDKNDMRIRWENGEEITTTAYLQNRIIERVQNEIEEKEKKEKKEKKGKKGKSKKSKKVDQ